MKRKTKPGEQELRHLVSKADLRTLRCWVELKIHDMRPYDDPERTLLDLNKQDAFEQGREEGYEAGLKAAATRFLQMLGLKE